MTTPEILELLVQIDARFPTDQWTVGGVHVLPMFRYEVYNTNYDLYQRAPSTTPVGRVGRLRERVKGSLEGLQRRAKAEWVDRGANASLEGPVDAVLYSDGVSFVELLGKHYDRFIDPLKERLEREGLRTLTLTPHRTYHSPRHAPSYFVQPMLDRAHVRAALKSRVSLPEASLPGYEDMLREFPGVKMPSVRHMRRMALYLDEYTAVSARLLERLKPKVVYIVTYYGSERWAMMLAARRLGIATVDVQHGYSGDLHWAYSQWSRVPAGGHELLPQYFWRWTQSDDLSMKRWTDATHGAHRTLIGGLMFQQMWRPGAAASEVVSAFEPRVQALLDRHPRERAVLYTASGFEEDGQVRAIGEAIRATQGEFHWYCRMHPVRQRDGQRFARVLGESGATNFEVRESTALPLYALLRKMDLHVTESSSTIIEATNFGVPSVLWGSLEAPSFPAYIQSGWLKVAEPALVPAAMRFQLQARAKLPLDETASAPPGLDALLALAR